MKSKKKEQFVFLNYPARIVDNNSLRDPQREGYLEIRRHFQKSNETAYIQLPVGCGKTGLMGIAPFGLCKGRALIVAPNLTIRATIYKELDISNSNCFYLKRGVMTPPLHGPFLSELKTGANIHDCDNAHIVVANIQQFFGKSNKWYEKLDRGYFDMILIDEGHHAPAETWQRLFGYFQSAKIIGFSGTPFRSDGQPMIGKCIYSFPYTRAMISGYISPIEAVHITPTELTFTVKGETKTLTLKKIRKMSEQDWFSKGVALSEVCNKAIVEASIGQLHNVRRFGDNRQIIAVACSIRHATMVAALYRERGLKAEVISSEQGKEQQDKVEAELRKGLLDVIVQVQMLGEGYDLGSLSVGAVFRPYRHLAPYVQFVGRILRLADPEVPHSSSNKVYLVSHVGLNDERWWTEFTQFDKRDQAFFKDMIETGEAIVEEDNGPRMTLRPFMRVLNETITEYAIKGYLKKVDRALIQGMMEDIRRHGFDPVEFGLTEEVLKARLSIVGPRTLPATTLPVQYQRRREQLRIRLSQDARSAADTVMNRLDIKHGGGNLIPFFPGKGTSNIVITIAVVSGWLNSQANLKSGEREKASVEQLELMIDKVPDSVDVATKLIGDNLKRKRGKNNAGT